MPDRQGYDLYITENTVEYLSMRHNPVITGWCLIWLLVHIATGVQGFTKKVKTKNCSWIIRIFSHLWLCVYNVLSICARNCSNSETWTSLVSRYHLVKSLLNLHIRCGGLSVTGTDFSLLNLEMDFFFFRRYFPEQKCFDNPNKKNPQSRLSRKKLDKTWTKVSRNQLEVSLLQV